MFKRIASPFFLVLLITSGLTGRLQADNAGPSNELVPLEIKPSSRVDENLFLLRLLDTIYAEWPKPTDTSPAAAGWAVDQKLQLERIIDHARKKKLDGDVVDLLSEVLRLFKQYHEYLVEIGAVEQSALD